MTHIPKYTDIKLGEFQEPVKKTNYGTLTEYLTLLIMEMKITTTEAATILKCVALISDDEFNKGFEKGQHETFKAEHAEHNNYDDFKNENV